MAYKSQKVAKAMRPKKRRERGRGTKAFFFHLATQQPVQGWRGEGERGALKKEKLRPRQRLHQDRPPALVAEEMEVGTVVYLAEFILQSNPVKWNSLIEKFGHVVLG